MPWEAKTLNARIVVGARLFVFENPRLARQASTSLPAPTPLPIEFVNTGITMRAEALDRSGNVVILELEDGTIHEMTPRKKGESGSGIAIVGQSGEDWIIRF